MVLSDRESLENNSVGDGPCSATMLIHAWLIMLPNILYLRLLRTSTPRRGSCCLLHRSAVAPCYCTHIDRVLPLVGPSSGCVYTQAITEYLLGEIL